jgi:hypothetical protein
MQSRDGIQLMSTASSKSPQIKFMPEVYSHTSMHKINHTSATLPLQQFPFVIVIRWAG